MYNMVFCVVTDVNVEESKPLPKCEVALFGFNGLGEVDYERELKGESDKFEAVCKLSGVSECGIVCACHTNSRGLKRKSAAVTDKGKLMGISDMIHVIDGENFKSGSSLGFYRVNGCKVGLCIENDLLFPDTFKSLAMCGCNVITVMLQELKDGVPPLLIRAYAYLYGIPIIMCAGKTAYFADISGAIASSNQSVTLFDISPQNEYHIVTTRARGISSDSRPDY